MTHKLYHTLGSLMLLLAETSIAERSYLSPERIYAGDTTELIIEYDTEFASLYPLDSSPLLEAFELLDSKSNVVRIEDNSQTFYRMQWRLQIFPRQTGLVTVPSLSFGDNASSPLVLEVAPIPPALAASQRVFVEHSVTPKNPYVGQQIQLQTRLFHNTPISTGRLSLPEASSASIIRNDKDKHYSLVRDAEQYNLRERSRLIFADKAGQLLLSPASYRGAIEATTNALGDTVRRAILRRSEMVKIAVRKPPAAFLGKTWLPAQRLDIEEHWEHENASIRVGDLLDWTLKINARGLAAQALPENLLNTDSSDFRIYADQAVRTDRIEAGDIIGSLEQRFAIVATRAGLIELPRFEMSWWDVNAERERILQLPPRSIVVAIAGDSSSSNTTTGDGIFVRSDISTLQIVLAATLILLLVSGIYTTRHHLRELLKSHLVRRQLRLRLRRACLNHDPSAARQALIDWSRECWPQHKIHSLHQIASAIAAHDCGPEFARLDAALFADSEPNWQGTKLWQLIVTLPKHNAKLPLNPSPQLPGFYPS